MKTFSRIRSYLICVILCACLTGIFFHAELAPYMSTLILGSGYECFLQVSQTDNQELCLVRWRNDRRSKLDFRFFSRDGKPLRRWTAALPFSTGKISEIIPVDTETALIVFYEDRYVSTEDLDKDQREMSVCAAHASGSVVRMAAWDCLGETAMERNNYAMPGSFLREAGGGRLMVLLGSEILTCVWSQENDTLTVESRTARDGAICAAIFPDGSVLAGGDGFVRYAGSTLELPEQIIGGFKTVERGVYMIDLRGGDIYYSELGSTGWILSNNFSRALRENTVPYGRGDSYRLLTDWTITSDGSFLCLQDGQSVYEIGRDGTRHISTGISCWMVAAVLSAVALGVLLAAFLLYLLMFYRRRGRQPLSLHWGAVVATLGLLLWVLFSEYIIRPGEYVDLLTTYHKTFVSVNRMVFAGRPVVSDSSERRRTLQVATMLEDAGFEDVRVYVLTDIGGGRWASQNGVRAELLTGFSQDLMALLLEREEQKEKDSSLAYIPRFNKDELWIIQHMDERYILLNASAESSERIQNSKTLFAAKLGFNSLILLMFICLIMIHRDVRSIAKGMELYAAGKEWKPVRVSGEDELQGIASTLNALAEDRAARRRENNRLVESYRRFAPEQILALLGKSSILEVDKSTVASHRMALLSVRCRFPRDFYTTGGTRLFDAVNRVLEQTVGIAVQKGGTVFNYSDDGYVVVMEAEPEQAASAAVAISQAALAMNERDTEYPPVSLHIALDIGDVSLGLVGSGEHVAPAAISASLARIRELLDLCECLDAGVLCTESIAQGARQYGSRYMGKCRVDGVDTRVNELYDGDAYELRKSKAASSRRFSEAVLLLYSGSVQRAKHMFLELVHEAPADGGARYYLYLADRMERAPDTRCELNAAFTDRTNTSYHELP